jgi:hypothetical protein
VIIAGCRDIYDYEAVRRAVENSGFQVTEVVSGCATGVDTLGERWAEENGVPVKRFPADWNKYGKAAGGMRNGDMAVYARDGGRRAYRGVGRGEPGHQGHDSEGQVDETGVSRGDGGERWLGRR